MGYSFAVKPKIVGIMRHKDPSCRGSECKLRRVVNSREARLESRRHVNTATAKTSRDATRYVLVQMKSDRHPLGCFFDMLLAQLFFDRGRMLWPHLLFECAFRPHLLLDLVEVFKVVGERCMDVG